MKLNAGTESDLRNQLAWQVAKMLMLTQNVMFHPISAKTNRLATAYPLAGGLKHHSAVAWLC